MQLPTTPSEFCLLCEGTRLRYLFPVNGHPLFECEDCGFVFLNPQPSDEVLGQIYKADYLLEDQDSGGGDHECVAVMKQQTAQLYLSQLIRYCGKPAGRLLEIGCGKGDFLVLARATGFDVMGVDVSPHAVATATSRLGAGAVTCGNADALDLPEEYFDVCVLFDTLEHVRRPVALLTHIHRSLKPGAVLFVVTPSLDSWSATLMGSRWPEFKTEHLHYFDTQTIQNVLARTGFEKVRITPNSKYLSVGYVNSHFERFRVALYTPLVSAVTRLLPAPMRKRPFAVVSSGMNVLARKAALKPRPRLSIIVPVYNEKATVGTLVDSVVNKQISGIEKEIIIVESNSTDGTRDEVMRYEEAAGVAIVLEERPRGKGHAVRTGLLRATGDFVIIQDGDLEYDINDYEKDPFTMYKVFRRDCLHGLTLKANRFDFDWELVIKLLRKGYRPLEIPVNYRSRSFKQGKKVSFSRDPLTWIWALVRFRLEPLYKDRL
ncbi:MAG: methyltransferase domain-containing protein [Acidobacteria bacterium]|nr:methyltransferase domain-containing protein [Acidobacteriota bacterium]